MQTMYFVHDLETDKIHFHTGGKAEWLKLPESFRKDVSRFCLFSKSRECWMTKGSASSAWYVLSKLKEQGVEDRGKQGERLTIAERVELQQEKAESRAERYEDRADKASTESDRLITRSHDMMSVIPMGQPILVGHHSEKRDRNYRDRAWNMLGAGFKAGEKAKHYEGRAATARSTAEGAKYSNPSYLGNRIKETEKQLRDLELRFQGKSYVYSDPKPISDEYNERLNGIKDKALEELEFYRHCLETCGHTVYNRESLKGATHVKIRGRWEEIVRRNPTTVSVPNICYQTRESQLKWPLKYAYTEVQDARSLTPEQIANPDPHAI